MLIAAAILWLFGFVVTFSFVLSERFFANKYLNAIAGFVLAALFGWAIATGSYAYAAFVSLSRWLDQRRHIGPVKH